MLPATNDFRPTMDQVRRVRREFDAATRNGVPPLQGAASFRTRAPKSNPQSFNTESSRTIPERTRVGPGNREIFIIVMGATGSGKKYFCRTAARADGIALGSGPGSRTAELTRYQLTLDDEGPVTLLKTSEFNDSSHNDTATPNEKAVAMRKAYARGRKFSGILYFHRISDTLTERPAITDAQLQVFQELCGDDSGMLKNVVLVTNRWDLVESEGEGIRRGVELASDPRYWKPMLLKGSQVARFRGTTESALELIQLAIYNTPQPLKIQCENMPLPETSTRRFVEAAMDSLRKDLQMLLEEESERSEKDIGRLRREQEMMKADAKKVAGKMVLLLQKKDEDMQVLLKEELEHSKRGIGKLHRQQEMMKADAKKVVEEMELVLQKKDEDMQMLLREESEHLKKEIGKLGRQQEMMKADAKKVADEMDLVLQKKDENMQVLLEEELEYPKLEIGKLRRQQETMKAEAKKVAEETELVMKKKDEDMQMLLKEELEHSKKEIGRQQETMRAHAKKFAEEMELVLRKKDEDMQVLLKEELERSKKEIDQQLRKQKEVMKADAKKVAEKIEADAEKVSTLLSEELERMGNEIAELGANIRELEHEQRRRDERDLKNAGYDAHQGQASATNALSVAVRNQDPRIIRLLLAKGANLALCIVQPNGVDSSALHLAAEMGYGDAIDIFIESGVELDIVDSSGNTALAWAARSGHKAVVERLLRKGANPNIKNKFNTSPLLEAARHGHEAVASLLLAKGAEIDHAENEGNTPLITAAAYGHEAVVRLLLEKRAKLDTTNKTGHTALTYAALTGHEAIVGLLLTSGANLDTTTATSDTALTLATKSGYGSIVRLLGEYRARLVSSQYLSEASTLEHLPNRV